MSNCLQNPLVKEKVKCRSLSEIISKEGHVGTLITVNEKKSVLSERIIDMCACVHKPEKGLATMASDSELWLQR
jgi:hypothetical protein